jgi:alkanesulfonate monooxygenase SsuD/methylene tetrahydromethanopterin reductase-like flavin-dependent oxidoreductase (luciferase family)
MNRLLPAIGVIFHPAFPPETLADFARQAESAGFDELWLWDDCFLPGALTSAAIALSATHRLKVGIGLLPATAYNPLFAAMEITTLARAFPGRILPGFGHGVHPWMVQIGAAPKSSLKALQETVTAVGRLLSGETVTMDGEQVHLDNVQMKVIPVDPPPIFIGAMREKTLQLAGRVADGAILTSMSSPAYVRWALDHIQAGMAQSGRTESGSTGYQLVVNVDVKVNPDGDMARSALRRSLARRLPWVDAQLNAPGIAGEVAVFIQEQGVDGIVERLPDAWLDLFGAAGTPEHVIQILQRLIAAGPTSLVLQPLDGDPACLDEYIQYLLPRLKPGGSL